jgi:hypothetical protein
MIRAWVDVMLQRRENTRTAGAMRRAVSVSTKYKVMDVHPSRSAAICLHRMTAVNHPLFARGNRSASVGTFPG